MSLNLQNEAALRLQRGGTRQAMNASALFGRSCRLLDSPANRDRVADVPRLNCKPAPETERSQHYASLTRPKTAHPRVFGFGAPRHSVACFLSLGAGSA